LIIIWAIRVIISFRVMLLIHSVLVLSMTLNLAPHVHGRNDVA
jgi:hypothetical protein